MLGRRLGFLGIALAATLCVGEERLPTPDPGATFEDQVRQTALRALDANQALLAERATLYTGPDAAANLADLRGRVENLDALISQSAGLMHELIWIGRERSQAARLMNGGPVEVAEANRITERLDLEEARLVEALVATSDAMQALNSAYPEAARFLDVDSAAIESAFTYTELPTDVATPTLPGDEAEALAHVAETFADVDRAIDRARDGIASGRTPAYALTQTAEAVLEQMFEEDPLAAGLAEMELERWRDQEENRRALLAAADVALLAGAIFTGGTLSAALALSSGVASVGLTGDFLIDAHRTRTLADTHADPHEGLASQSEARDATLDAVVAGALQVATGALVARSTARALTRPQAASTPAATGPQKGLVQGLDADAPLGSGRAYSAATDESLPMGERMLAGVREITDAPIRPEAAEALAARAQAAQRRAAELRAAGSDLEDEALLAQRMQRSNTVRRFDEVGSANFREADDLVQEWVRGGEPLTLERIQELNRILGRDLPHNGAVPGRLRAAGDEDVFDAGLPARMYIPSEDVARAMDDFFAWYRSAEASGMPPVELAARTYQRLVSVHPFHDGNGRTSRLVMDYVLRRNGLPPAALDENRVAAFGFERALGVDGLSTDPTDAVEIVTRGVERSLELLAR